VPESTSDWGGFDPEGEFTKGGKKGSLKLGGRKCAKRSKKGAYNLKKGKKVPGLISPTIRVSKKFQKDFSATSIVKK